MRMYIMDTLTAEQLKQVITNLRNCKKLITPRDKWCQGVQARTKEGIKILDNSSRAYSYCIAGAIRKVLSNFIYDIEAFPEYEYLTKVMNEDAVIYNDTHTHEEVLAKFNEAIELASCDLINLGHVNNIQDSTVDWTLQTR